MRDLTMPHVALTIRLYFIPSARRLLVNMFPALFMSQKKKKQLIMPSVISRARARLS